MSFSFHVLGRWPSWKWGEPLALFALALHLCEGRRVKPRRERRCSAFKALRRDERAAALQMGDVALDGWAVFVMVGLHMRAGRQASLVTFVRGGIAASCAALVFVLGLFAASPSLHAHLHGAIALGDDHQCAIAAFANGVSVPLGMEMVQPPVAHVVQWCTPGVAEIYLGSPRFLLQPERGPPQA